MDRRSRRGCDGKGLSRQRSLKKLRAVLVVRPGFVHTRMTRGLEPAPLATTAEGVAGAVVRGLERGAHTVWAPPSLRWLMLTARMLPRAVFRRMKQ